MQQHDASSAIVCPTPFELACKLAGQHAARADREYVLASVVVDALTAAGFACHFVPVCHGGRAGTFSELSTQAVALAQHCPNASWCAVIQAITGRMAAYLPPMAQASIWREGPHTRVSASFRCTGTVDTVDDGWRLSGKWHYLTGIDFAGWALLMIEPGGDDPEPRFVAVPASAWNVQDDWRTLGMRGTGSRSIALDGAFVPRHMSFLGSDLLGGQSLHAAGPQYEASPIAADAQLFLSCALGAAQSCMEHWGQALQGCDVPDEAAIAYSGATSAVDTCLLILQKNCSAIDQGYLSPRDTARSARDAAFAAGMLADATQRIFRLGGARVHDDSHPIQKAWRDVQTLTSHVALRAGTSFIGYARHALAGKGA